MHGQPSADSDSESSSDDESSSGDDTQAEDIAAPGEAAGDSQAEEDEDAGDLTLISYTIPLDQLVQDLCVESADDHDDST